ncbi:hypothetical protein [Lentzea sp. NBRC 102530]|uniref:hypothetical protein n=1 Tax=Lentzea sp. NBRC 102530 TaxID=3032201 RepID=UPI0024A5C7D3|nr:hypothetical protein [Lentzea sp. NBRC 102530]GLY50801.1 hypothetical protein Lesp01_44570 [Lentzea sp. NBRC 102530]
MRGEHGPHWIDSDRFPEDVIATIEALRPGEDLFVVRDGVPLAKITGAARPSPASTTGTSEAYDDVTVVATAMKLSPSARATLSGQLGPDYIVLDMHSAPRTAEVLLIPPLSPQLIGGLRASFPKARVVIAEVEDRELGVVHEGPVRRLLDAGADVYFPPSSIPRLAQQLDRAVTHLNQLEAASGAAAPLVIEPAKSDEERPTAAAVPARRRSRRRR